MTAVLAAPAGAAGTAPAVPGAPTGASEVVSLARPGEAPDGTLAESRAAPNAHGQGARPQIRFSEAALRALLNPAAGTSAAARRADRAQVVDPTVSRVKFAREVEWWTRYEEVQRRRGFLLVEAAFPRIVIAICAAHVRPQVVLFGIVFDYTNWDLEPPSVRVVDAFTRRPLAAKELTTVMKRLVPTPPVAAPTAPTAPGDVAAVEQACVDSLRPADAPRPAVSSLLQFTYPDDVPFLCMRGVFEYHAHPAHTGDAWWPRRGTGAGTLGHLLNVFHTYAVAPILGIRPLISVRQVGDHVEVNEHGVTLATRLPA